MTIEDLKDTWEFSKDLTEGCEIKCPECGEFSNHIEWKESSVYCELCSEHSAIECPNCGERHDHVYSSVFEVRN